MLCCYCYDKLHRILLIIQVFASCLACFFSDSDLQQDITSQVSTLGASRSFNFQQDCNENAKHHEVCASHFDDYGIKLINY
jgi:hypothetical protein